MKFLALLILLSIITISLPAAALAGDGRKDVKPAGKVEQSTAADPHVTVTLCVMSGEITVKGWEKNEVRARSTDVGQIELRRIDKTRNTSNPPTRLDVMISDKSGVMDKVDCQAAADVELDVPQGATVQVQTRDGDITIEGVAAAYAGSQNGDINIDRASRLVEAGSVGGSISLKDSSGRVNLSSAGGGVDAINIRASDPGDTFEVGTVSGDIRLDKVNNTKVVAKSVNGNVMMTGPLAHGGRYAFTTMSGDVTLTLPPDASFQLNAKISQNRDIESDFPLTFTPDTGTPVAPPITPRPSATTAPTAQPPRPSVKPLPRAEPLPGNGTIVSRVIVGPTVAVAPFSLRRLTAVRGSGDAVIYVASFSGTLHLQKK